VFDFIYTVLGAVFGPILGAIYHVVNNYGVAIILFTLFCRVLMLPSAVSQQKNQAKNQRIQYKMRKITEKYKDDRQRLAQEQQEFYKREGYNPMSAGCSGGMLLQFPIIFGLIAAIYRPLKYALNLKDDTLSLLTVQTQKILDAAKPFVEKLAEAKKAGTTFDLTAAQQKLVDFSTALGAGGTKSTYLQLRIVEHLSMYKDKIPADLFRQISDFASGPFRFLGLELGKIPKEGGTWVYFLIPVLVGVTSMATSLYTMIRQRKTNPEQKQGAAMMGVMSLGMPLMSVWFSLSFPVGIGIYWIVSSLAALVQIVVLGFTHPPQKMLAKSMVDETIERRSRENSRKRVNE